MMKEIIVIDKTISNKDLSKIFFACSSYELDHICLQSTFINRIPELKEYVKIAGIVDFPSGMSSSKSRKIEVDNLIKNGASIIDIVLNHNDFINKDYKKIEKDLFSSKKICSDVEFRVIIEYRLYEDKYYELSSLLKYIGVDTVITSTGTFVDDPIDNIIFAHNIIKLGLKPICTNITRSDNDYGVLKSEQIHGIRFTSLKSAENILKLVK